MQYASPLMKDHGFSGRERADDHANAICILIAREQGFSGPIFALAALDAIPLGELDELFKAWQAAAGVTLPES
jgi:hypothetical protein